MPEFAHCVKRKQGGQQGREADMAFDSQQD